MKRREVLSGLAAASMTNCIAPTLFAQTTAGRCTLAPQTGEGPFYFDPKLLRTDIREDRQGIPLELVMHVAAASDCSTIKAVRADVWHTDATGIYSGYGGQAGSGEARSQSAKGKTYLRGTQVTDDAGTVVFKTIYPGWYPNRTPHIHFKVFLDAQRVVTSEIVFPENTNNEIFGKVAPYRARPARGKFSAIDRFLRNDGRGVLCEVQRQGEGYRASVTVGISNI